MAWRAKGAVILVVRCFLVVRCYGEEVVWDGRGRAGGGRDVKSHGVQNHVMGHKPAFYSTKREFTATGRSRFHFPCGLFCKLAIVVIFSFLLHSSKDDREGTERIESTYHKPHCTGLSPSSTCWLFFSE